MAHYLDSSYSGKGEIMKESEVWQEATKVWEKRKKIDGRDGYEFEGLSVMKLESGEWGIDMPDKFYLTTTQVHRFLDGLE